MEFNFQAPQYVESLASVENVDDKADNFFDAVENVTGKPSGANNAENNKLSSVDEQTTMDKSFKENQEPESIMKFETESKLPRKSIKIPKASLPLRRSARFTSLAQQVHNFHHATPPRFKRTSGTYKAKGNKFLPTIARSPLLQTKIRARPSTAPSVKEQERPMIKPVKVPQMKAKPPPKPAPKPATVPKPFNLTDPNKFKKLQKQDNESPMKKTEKSRKPVNVKEKVLEMDGDKVVVKENWAITGLKTYDKPNKRTKVVPFSFEQRNEERLRAKHRKLEEAKENKPVAVLKPSSAKGASK